MALAKHRWKDQARCIGLDQSLFFEQYESDQEPYVIRKAVDELCDSCPVKRICFAYGITPDDSGYHNYGVFGGVYMTDGKIDEEINSHKDWNKTYLGLVTG